MPYGYGPSWPPPSGAYSRGPPQADYIQRQLPSGTPPYVNPNYNAVFNSGQEEVEFGIVGMLPCAMLFNGFLRGIGAPKQLKFVKLDKLPKSVLKSKVLALSIGIVATRDYDYIVDSNARWEKRESRAARQDVKFIYGRVNNACVPTAITNIMLNLGIDNMIRKIST